tara:strand:+ start:552 stop:1166 length:615 start_codon:yes stop_codon:yes gene_type:complete
MPNFAPNKGFKMPGVGSKNIDSPGNFRDEQHVDKVGYCDTTEDSMLPEGSSPLKARYTQSGYLKDLDAISIPQGKKTTATKAPKKQEKVVVKKEDTKPTKKKVDFRANRKFNTDLSYDKTVTAKGKTPGKTTYKAPTRTAAGDLAYSKLTQAQKDKQDADYRRINTKTTPGSKSSLTGNTKVKTNDKKEDIVLGGYSKDSWKRK